MNPSHRAVWTDDSIDFLAGLSRVSLQERTDTVAILGMHSLKQILAFIEDTGVASPDPFEGRAHIQELIVNDIEHPEDLADACRHLAESFIALFPAFREDGKRALSFFGRAPAQPKVEEASEDHERHRGRFPVARQGCEFEIQFVARRKQVA